ncbi:leucine--tRNA ligase [Candidatus Kuenenbacteria bacterium]|nr:leucine--tRNA ligase [Candidatus Kuenenbacteria bacterium]
MEKYNPQLIEPKWQIIWEEQKLFRAKESASSADGDENKKKFYGLIEFPYPSGDGLHTGHLRSNTAMDIIARKRRMQGYSVLYPIGFDAFGLPTENYAIKKKIKPQEATAKNIATFTKQLKEAGFSFDWSRSFSTTDEDYYKWTQWIFVQMFKHGLAEKKKETINWCTSCKIGLANEEVVNGVCERCGGEVIKKDKEQWVLKITQYADRLIEDLDLVNYLERIKTQQINWIGKSEGASIKFPIFNFQFPNKSQISNSNNQDYLEVFTTRPDTLFGVTFMVVAPEHSIIKNQLAIINNKEEVLNYIEEAKNKSELERTDLNKEKTGVEIKGIKAINPVNGKEIPIFVADYVVMGYGTGAIMAVPAHDERDFEFAKKYGIEIKQVVALKFDDYKRTIKVLEALKEIQDKATEQKLDIWLLGGLASAFVARTIYRVHEDLDLIVKNDSDLNRLKDLLLNLGYIFEGEQNYEDDTQLFDFRSSSGVKVQIGKNQGKLGIENGDFINTRLELAGVTSLVLSERFLENFKKWRRTQEWVQDYQIVADDLDLEFMFGRVITEDGFAVNSGEFDGLSTREFKEKIIKWLEEKNIGKKQIQYKLHDWIFSRQRYWGEPIPMVYCEKCGWQTVPENELPIVLPEIDDYLPTDEGDSPLAKNESWVKTKCPVCGGEARRETDVMPNWAGSNWYFVRYTDPKNEKMMVDPERAKYWLPVDWYNGGMEHTTLHLLYSRFVWKFLYDIGAVPKECGVEPYAKRTAHGMILGEGGVKMSKSKGNVINPDEYVKKYGADTLRVYEMFMGPFDQPIAWEDKSVNGVYRFLNRVWSLQDKLQASSKSQTSNSKLITLLHQTIKKVEEDIEEMKFNTAVAQMMIFLNELEKTEELSQGLWEKFILILSPFAPHLAEELWQNLGHKESLVHEKWPEYDPALIRAEEFELVIQINGKVRERILVATDIGEEEVKELALKSDKVQKWLEGKEPKKMVYIKGKLLSMVI